MSQRMTEKIRGIISQSLTSELHRARSIPLFGPEYLNFSSNDYLSLSAENKLKEAWKTAVDLYSVGSGGSPVITGYSFAHQQLEKVFSEALGVDDSIFFPSGYVANLSVMSLLGHLGFPVFIDKSVHASIYDGLKLAELKAIRYLHCSDSDLEKLLKKSREGIVVSESVFSMSGQIAPLKNLVELTKQYSADIVVDEAHAFGVMGDEGLGLVKALHLTQNDIPLRIIPLGKAFAANGAIVAGHGQWIDALLQTARPYIYSTATSPAFMHVLLKNFELLRHANDRRIKLAQLIDYFRNAIKNTELCFRNSVTPIQQLQMGCPYKAKSLAEKLLRKKIICLPIRQPTVTKKETGLRILLNYHHQTEDIDQLIKCIQENIN